jgi:sporulation integral membrane protein YtvI
LISFYKKYYKTVFDIALMILTIYLFMLLFSFLYRIAAPIFLALIIYAVIEPFARFLNKRGMKKTIASAISTILFVLLILALFIGLGAIFTVQISSLIQRIPDYAETLQKQIILLTDDLQHKLEAMPPDLAEKTREYAGIVSGKASAVLAGMLGWLIGKVTSISTFVVNFSIGVILAFFLSIEIQWWKQMAREKTPKTFKSAYYFLKENVLLGIVSYVKAQLKLITLTFAIVFIGLLVLGVRNAFSLSLLAAIIDVLPLLGISAFFIPWIVYLFIVGNSTLAFWLIGLLVLVVLVRQFMEPKITGDSIGVSAFTMLSFMIVSLSLFGVAGLILSPILIITIKALIKQGYLQRWIRLPEEEYEETA